MTKAPYDAPPPLAAKLLRWSLGPSADAATVLGDVHEEYVDRVEAKGGRAARRWYWREAVTLGASAWMGRLLGRPMIGHEARGRGTMRDVWTTNGLLQDASYAVRAIRGDRAFFLFATLIIGLGVGASTAVFSVMSPLLIQPLPFEEPSRLIFIDNGDGTGGLSGITSRTSNVRDFREQVRSLDGIAGYNAFFDQQSFNLSGSGQPERLVGATVTTNLLDVLGVTPEVGRNFTDEEGLVDGPPAVLLTHGFWVRRFAEDPTIVGSSLTLNDEPFAVVGVLPPTFDFASIFTPTVEVDFLLPWPIADETDNWGNTTTMVARLQNGATIETTQSELESVVAALEQADPERWGLGARTSGLQERIARPFRSGLYLLAAAAALVMLIVCVNLSNMLLARSPRRKREMAVRRTLGATRGRLIRQLLVESVLLSMSGALVGVLLAQAATRFVSTSQGLEIPMLSAISVDGMALAFTISVAVLAGLGVGIIPALQVSEAGEADALGGSTRGGGGTRGARRFRELLVISEVAMACVLLVFGGLVVRSFSEVMNVDLGFESENLIAWQLASSQEFDTLPEINAFFDQVVEAVEAVPGVEAVGLVDALPLGTNRTWGTQVVDKEYTEENGGDGFFPHVVDDRYLEAMGIELLEGRYILPTDVGDSPPVIVVSEEAARTIFEGDAIGRRISMWYGEPEVVGVVSNVKHRSLELQADPEIYFPMRQIWAFQTVDMVVRSPLPPESMTAAVGNAIRQVEAQMPTEDFRTLDSVVERSVSPRRFTLQLLIAFAASALLLASLGIYGVLSYSVTERVPEIGIRMALGESADDVRMNIVRQTMGLTAIGIVVGVLFSIAGTRMISSLLYGVEPTDPVTFGVMIVILSVVALVSGLVPAIRASRTDTATALRSAA
ncbi:MAG: ADOP family duplicated permease [Gemmatimonadota bacterium]